MSPKEGICLCLVYLRQKPIFEILGLLFDISKTKANDAFNYWLDILRDIFPASQIEEVETDSQKYQELQRMLSEYELIVLKNQFIVLLVGEDIVDVCVGMLGKTSEINLFRDTRQNSDRLLNLNQ